MAKIGSLLLSLAGALLHCGPADAATERSRSAPHVNDKSQPVTAASVRAWRSLNAFMHDRYGDGATPAPGSPWTVGTRMYRVCISATRQMEKAPHRLLGICRYDIEHNGHPDGGRIDLHLLRQWGSTFSLVGSKADVGAGSYGEVGAVSVMRFGRELYGFKIHDGYEGQGGGRTSALLFTANAKGIRKVGELPVAYEYENPLDCQHDVMGRTIAGIESSGIDIEYDIEADRRHPDKDVWPLSVHEKGAIACRPVSRHYRIDFDRKAWRYRIPEDLADYPEDIHARKVAAASAAHRWFTPLDFLKDVYGPRAELNGAYGGGEWTAAPEKIRAWRDDAMKLRRNGIEPTSVEFRVCDLKTVSIRGARHQVLVVCGRPPEVEGVAMKHDPLVLGVYLLRERDGMLSLIDSRRHLFFEDSGNVGVDVDRLGYETYGIGVTERVAAGFTIRYLTIGASGIREAGLFPNYLHGSDRANPDLDFTITVDDKHPHWEHWSLRMQVRGTENGKPVSRRHRLVFDKKASHYVIPDALKPYLARLQEHPPSRR